MEQLGGGCEDSEADRTVVVRSKSRKLGKDLRRSASAHARRNHGEGQVRKAEVSSSGGLHGKDVHLLGNGDGRRLRAWGGTAGGEGIRDAAIGGVDTAPRSEEVLEKAEGVQAARKGGIAASGEELSAAKVGAIFLF